MRQPKLGWGRRGRAMDDGDVVVDVARCLVLHAARTQTRALAGTQGACIASRSSAPRRRGALCGSVGSGCVPSLQIGPDALVWEGRTRHASLASAAREMGIADRVRDCMPASWDGLRAAAADANGGCCGRGGGGAVDRREQQQQWHAGPAAGSTRTSHKEEELRRRAQHAPQSGPSALARRRLVFAQLFSNFQVKCDVGRFISFAGAFARGNFSCNPSRDDIDAVASEVGGPAHAAHF
jgi:hypothetical protein